MKILMLKSTFHGKFFDKGKEYEVDEPVGLRWIRNGIAKSLEKIRDANMGDLWAMARDKGIANYRKMKKDELLEALNAQPDVVENG